MNNAIEAGVIPRFSSLKRNQPAPHSAVETVGRNPVRSTI
jgi:hypothetical protein